MGNSTDSISLSIQTGNRSIPEPIFLSLAGNALSEQKLKDWLKTQGIELFTYTTTLHVAYPLLPTTAFLAFGDKGNDVSHHQGVIRWPEYQGKFAIIKVTEGIDFVDPQAPANWTGAEAKGIPRSAMHFYRPEHGARAQVEKFFEINQGDTGELGATLDLEESPFSPDPAMLPDPVDVRLWLTLTEERSGKRTRIYTGPNFWKKMLAKWGATRDMDFSMYLLFAASWGTALDLPKGWTSAEFWQTGQGKVAGIDKPVDLVTYLGEKPPPVVALPFGPLFWPTNFVSVTQPYGVNPAKYPMFGTAGHEGIDMTAPTGTPIYAAEEGTVVVVGTDLAHAYGNHVRIDHRDGYQSIYAHHKENRVVVGQKVVRGQEIAKADSTGNSTGSHLHFSLKLRGASAAGKTKHTGDFIDPTPFFVELVPLTPQSGLLYELAKSAANVRKEPVVGDNIITTLLVGNQFTATGKTTTDKGWWEIMLLDGRKGWMWYQGNGVKIVS